MRSIFRVLWPCIAAVVFLGWWENTTSQYYAGPQVWGLVMAGLFWLSVAAAVYMGFTEVRSLLARRGAAQHRPAA